MTRLANSQEFLSTLGEHILYDGGSSLVAFWPLLTSQGLNPYGPAQLPLTEFVFQESGTVPTAEPALSFDGISVVADDVGTTYLAPNIVSAHAVKYKFPSGPITPIVLDSSTLTFSVWTYIEDVQDAQLQWSIDESTSATFLDLDRSSGVWSITGMTGPVSLLATSIPALPTYKWTLISLRMTLPSGLIECWVDDRTPVTGTMTGGVVPSTATFDNVTVGASQQGNVSYLQVHVGDFTYAQHLAQFQMGLNGLEYQTTGARIRTVLGYAGVASTDLNRVDTGVSVMQRASLAGKTPAIAAAEASSTERGSLYAAGDGQIVFADRKRLYNI